MRRRVRRWWWMGSLCAALVVPGCGTGTPGSEPDGGVAVDAGASPDAGERPDAGPVAPVDFVVTDAPAWQQLNDLAIAGGDVLAVWHDESERAPDDDLAAIRARRIGLDGVAASSEVLVNTKVLGRQELAKVATWPDGAAVVIWHDAAGPVVGLPGESDGAIRFRLLDDRGQPVGEDAVALAGGGPLADVAVLDDGSFVVVGMVAGTGTPTGPVPFRIWQRRFAVDGAPLGEATEVSPPQPAVRLDSEPLVFARAGGGHAVVYLDQTADVGSDTGGGIRYRRYAADGTAEDASSRRLETAGLFPFAVTGLPDGGLALVSAATRSGPGGEITQAVRFRVFDGDGSPRSADHLPYVNDPGGVDHIGFGLALGACDGEPLIVTSWVDATRGGDASIRARLFDGDGAPVVHRMGGDADDFEIAVPPAGASGDLPLAAAGPDGDVAFVWIERRGGTDDPGNLVGRVLPGLVSCVGVVL